jgi:hypothetical protein
MARAVEEKLRNIGFSVETSKTPEQIREAGRRACAAAYKRFECGIDELEDSDDSVEYFVSPVGLTGGLGRPNAVFTVDWTAADRKRRTVRMRVTPEDCAMYQERMLGIIPTGPWKAPALKALRRFAEAMRIELLAE